MKEIFCVFCLILIALTAKSLTIEKARMNPLQGYVLTDSDFKVADESGVRIGPLDLKYLTPELMDKIGLSPDMIELLSPYTQIYGENALTLVRGKPFRLTREQYETLESRMKSFFCQIYDSLPPDQKNDPTVNNNFAFNHKFFI